MLMHRDQHVDWPIIGASFSQQSPFWQIALCLQVFRSRSDLSYLTTANVSTKLASALNSTSGQKLTIFAPTSSAIQCVAVVLGPFSGK